MSITSKIKPSKILCFIAILVWSNLVEMGLNAETVHQNRTIYTIRNNKRGLRAVLASFKGNKRKSKIVGLIGGVVLGGVFVCSYLVYRLRINQRITNDNRQVAKVKTTKKDFCNSSNAHRNQEPTLVVDDITNKEPITDHVVVTPKYKILKGYGSIVSNVAWSPDNKKLAWLNADDNVRVFNTEQEEESEIISFKIEKELSSNMNRNLAWANDSNRILSLSAQNTVNICDIAMRKNNTLENKVKPTDYPRVAWSPDNKKAIFTSVDGVVIWNLENKDKIPKPAYNTENMFWDIALSPDSEKIAYVKIEPETNNKSEKKLYMMNLSNGKETLIQTDKKSLMVIYWSPDSKKIAYVNNINHTLYIWNAAGKKQVTPLDNNQGYFDSVAWSPDSKKIAFGSCERKMVIYDISEEKAESFETGESYASNLTWSPSGKKIAYVGYRNVVVRNIQASKSILFRGHTASIKSIVWSHDGKRLASASDDGSVRIWDVGD